MVVVVLNSLLCLHLVPPLVVAPVDAGTKEFFSKGGQSQAFPEIFRHNRHAITSM